MITQSSTSFPWVVCLTNVFFARSFITHDELQLLWGEPCKEPRSGVVNGKARQCGQATMCLPDVIRQCAVACVCVCVGAMWRHQRTPGGGFVVLGTLCWEGQELSYRHGRCFPGSSKCTGSFLMGLNTSCSGQHCLLWWGSSLVTPIEGLQQPGSKELCRGDSECMYGRGGCAMKHEKPRHSGCTCSAEHTWHVASQCSSSG